MSEANPQPQQVLLYPQYPQNNEDEINLFDLWHQLAVRKALIFKITAFFVIMSIIAVLIMPRLWQAEIQFMPPKLENIQGLNIQGLNIQGLTSTPYTPGTVYKNFLENYQSLSQKRKFFNKNNLVTDYETDLHENKIKRAIQVEDAFQEFNESLKVNLPKKGKDILFVKSTLDFPEQKKSSEYLNQYAQMVKTNVLNNILHEIEYQLQLKKSYLGEQISSKQKIAKNNREDRIAVLNEAIKTAKLLNIKEGELQFIKGKSTNNPINKTTSLYYRGYESLEAEKKVLEERKSDIPFIKGIRVIEEKSFQLDEQLERIKSEKEKFSVVRIDQAALIPEDPIKPKRKLIVVITTILGFIFSLFVVFVLNVKQKYKEEYVNS